MVAYDKGSRGRLNGWSRIRVSGGYAFSGLSGRVLGEGAFEAVDGEVLGDRAFHVQVAYVAEFRDLFSVEVKKALEKAEGDREWGRFLMDLYAEAENARHSRAFEELAENLTDEDLKAISESSEEFRERFRIG